MKRSVALILTALVFALVSCKKEAEFERVPAAREEVAFKPLPPPGAPAAAAAADQARAAPAKAPAANRAPAVPRKLIRTVDLELEVKSPEDSAARV